MDIWVMNQHNPEWAVLILILIIYAFVVVDPGQVLPIWHMTHILSLLSLSLIQVLFQMRSEWEWSYSSSHDHSFIKLIYLLFALETFIFMSNRPKWPRMTTMSLSFSSFLWGSNQHINECHECHLLYPSKRKISLLATGTPKPSFSVNVSLKSKILNFLLTTLAKIPNYQNYIDCHPCTSYFPNCNCYLLS